MTDLNIKFTVLVVTTLIAVASVASPATDYSPALRELAAAGLAAVNAKILVANPTEQLMPLADDAVAAEKNPTAIVDAEGKNSKEWW